MYNTCRDAVNRGDNPLTDRRRFAERIWGYLRGVNGIIFILYLIFAFSSYGFLVRKLAYLPIYFALIVASSLFFGPLVLKLVSRLRLNGTELISKESYSLLYRSLCLRCITQLIIRGLFF